MPKRSVTRQPPALLALCLSLVLVFMIPYSALAVAQSMEQLAAEAAKGESIIWYGSETRDQTNKIAAAFHKSFPKVPLKPLRITGGVMAGKIIQEAQTGARTADVGSCGAGSTFNMDQRKLLANIDWVGEGMPKESVWGKSVVTSASVYAVIYNTKLVKPAEAPQTWEDLLNPRWKGRLGCWISSGGFAQLAKAWGEEKVTSYLEKFVSQKPFLFRSTYPMAQQVAAGEIPVAFGFYHTAQPPMAAGAPLQVAFMDPTPVSSILSSVIANSANLAGGKLLIRWLCSPKGAKVYEEITYRGNPMTEGTKTYELLKGKKLSEYSLEEMDLVRKLMNKYNDIIRSGGVEKK